MASAVNLGAYSDVMVVLATAGVAVPIVSRLGANPIISYLALGAILGPLGLGSLMGEAPLLYWFTIVEPTNVGAIAELGIVFLLFLIGLELSLTRLMAMRRLVFGLGFLQVLVTASVLALIANLFGIGSQEALVIGASLALSSTAIVVELLSKRKRMATGTGRASFSVLLAQDIAVVPLLLLVSILAAGSSANMFANIGMALLQAAASLAVIVFLGRVFLRRLFRLVGSLDSPEVFLAAVLFIIVGAGFVAALFGLSMSLGAFVAGLLLSETEYRKAVEAIVEPFKGLLLGVFFFTVGMSIDIAAFLSHPGAVVLIVGVLIAVKFLLLAPLARLFGLTRAIAIETALLLAPGGEFAFVGIGAGVAAGIVPSALAGQILTGVAISMALIPALALLGERLSKAIAPNPVDQMLDDMPGEMSGHAIVVGYGRVGKVVADMLGRHKLAFIAADADPALVARERRKGNEVFYGDAGNFNFLHACGLEEASALIITIQHDQVTDRIIELVRASKPDLPVVARARDAAHARHLYGLGVTNAVPETIEASLQLSEATLVSMGIPMGKVIASIHDRRDEFRQELK